MIKIEFRKKSMLNLFSIYLDYG